MQINKLPYPSKYNPEITPKCNYAGLADFLGVQYAPTNDIDRHSMLLSATQHACHFSDSTDMKVQEYIDTILSQFPDFSLQTLDGLDSNQERLLTDMLMRMNLSKLHETFGDYILWFLISQSYPYGRYESYLKPYCEKHMNFVKKYGWGRAEMIVYAAWRLGFKNTTFSEKMELLKIFTACMEVSHNNTIQSLLAKYIPENANQFRIDGITTRETMPLGWTLYNEEWQHNIHKNEYTKSEIYLDAPISLCLYYNDSIVALISGMLWGHNEFVICQMQAISSHVYTGHGVKKPNITNPILQTFNRQELLYESFVTILQQQGVTGIYIQPGDMNPRTTTMYKTPERNEYYKDYVEVATDIPHLSKKIAHQLYDVFAQTHGCVQDKSGFWKVENQHVVHKGKKNHTTKKLIKVSL